jgi:hypothetical protein
MHTKARKLIMESKQGWLLATTVHQKYFNTYRVFDSNRRNLSGALYNCKYVIKITESVATDLTNGEPKKRKQDFLLHEKL